MSGNFLPAFLLLSLVCVASCGGDGDDKPAVDTTTADTAADAADAAVDTAADTAADAVADSAVDTGAGDSGSGDVAADTGPKAPTCGEALFCTLGCPEGDKGCQDACSKDVATADAAKLAAVGACAVDLCKDVTEGSIATINCHFANCYDKIDSCVGFGGGAASCVVTTVCASACELGDAACKLACFAKADKDAAASAKALRVCADAKCDPKADPVTRASCIHGQCGGEISACTGDKTFDCTEGSSCVAHCPDSLAIKPNSCASACLAAANAGARTAFKDLSVCREQCVKAINPVACWSEKCGKELGACYGTGGSEPCQSIDNCVSETCEGVGSPFACMKTCLDKGKPASKDAFVQYEGCVARNMGTKEAKIAGCSFPYDQATCLPVIKGQFCGNHSQNCFTDK